MPGFFLKLGSPPPFVDQSRTQSWLEMLTKLAARIDGPGLPYWGTLVVAEGAGADGYFWVFIRANMVTSVNSSVTSSIVSHIDAASFSLGWVSNVPTKFAEATGLTLDASFG
ncbi:MAG: hypothetical protein LYZ70_07175 [Nitrososphaerales archaeon]|nr:hypothetical protein [Nitrososphaerales archaeon]